MIDKDKINITKIPFFIGNFVAIVPWPNQIFVVKGHETNARVIAHELAHLEQWSEHRWMFLPRYLSAWVKGGFKHANNAFEIEAYKREDRLITLAQEIIDERDS